MLISIKLANIKLFKFRVNSTSEQQMESQVLLTIAIKSSK